MQEDEKKVMAPTGKVGMEKVRGDEGISITQQQPVQLKCPRCNSSNTKFCYYNNYSLSQPRHFCKACKRYWTRGGTLRNVPVGGGCRKNKRLKRPPPTTTTTTTSASHQLHHPSSTSDHDHVINPYGLSNPHQLIGLPFPTADVHGYHHHHQLHPHPDQDLNAPAFGFSLGIMIMSSDADGGKQLFQDVDLDPLCSNNSPLSATRSNIPIFSSSAPSPTIHNLQSSTFHHQNHSRAAVKEETASQYTHLQALTSFEEEGKVQNRLEEYWNYAPYLNGQTHQLGFSSSEPSPLYWNSTLSAPIGASHDPPNFASSLDRVLHLPS